MVAFRVLSLQNLELFKPATSVTLELSLQWLPNVVILIVVVVVLFIIVVNRLMVVVFWFVLINLEMTMNEFAWYVRMLRFKHLLRFEDGRVDLVKELASSRTR